MAAAERVRTLRETVADGLRDAIASGSLPPGALIPAEETLASDYGVSRETVRRALEALEREGLLAPGQGRAGRRVQQHDRMVVSVTRTESRDRADERATAGADAWSADVRELGHEPGQRTSVAIEEPDAEVGRRLGMAPGDPVVVRRHVRAVDGVPHNISETHYPASLAEGTAIMHPADIPQGVIAYMRTEMGIEQVRFTVEFGARMPVPEEARALSIPPGIPVITEYRTGHSPDRPVKVTVTVWPADRTWLRCEFPA